MLLLELLFSLCYHLLSLCDCCNRLFFLKVGIHSRLHVFATCFATSSNTHFSEAPFFCVLLILFVCDRLSVVPSGHLFLWVISEAVLRQGLHWAWVHFLSLLLHRVLRKVSLHLLNIRRKVLRHDCRLAVNWPLSRLAPASSSSIILRASFLLWPLSLILIICHASLTDRSIIIMVHLLWELLLLVLDLLKPLLPVSFNLSTCILHSFSVFPVVIVVVVVAVLIVGMLLDGLLLIDKRGIVRVLWVVVLKLLQTCWVLWACELFIIATFSRMASVISMLAVLLDNLLLV